MLKKNTDQAHFLLTLDDVFPSFEAGSILKSTRNVNCFEYQHLLTLISRR